MNDKPITIVISDLHLGGGPKDLGDDHVYQGNQLSRFIRELPEAQTGNVELFINGDFLEFAQVLPEAYMGSSAKHWCSERESLEKLNAILAGHPDIFDALNGFQDRGNVVTVAPGNHDVDLYWDDVKKKLREKAGPIQFETGKELCARYGGRLLIGHGHMFDPANRFDRWDYPFLSDDYGTLRLEMCPGTLFMVKFVNWLEQEYSFADNVKPVATLARLLWNEKKAGFAVAAWMLSRFAGGHPLTALSARGSQAPNVGRAIRNELVNPIFLGQITKLYQEATGASATSEEVRKNLSSNEQIEEFIVQLVVKLPPEKWLNKFDGLGAGTMGLSGDGTLSIIRSGMAQDMENLRNEAKRFLAQGAEVVVFGHTHQSDEWRGSSGKLDGGYFNPGSWTRYVDVSKMSGLKLDDLRNESDFPYQLNFVRVEQSTGGLLRADKLCFEQANGLRFST